MPRTPLSARKPSARSKLGRGSRTKHRYTNRPTYQAGYNRTGGYYGRFQPGGNELKFHDVVFSGGIDATGEIAPGGGTSTALNLISQGTTESQRIGRKCVIKRIDFKGDLTLATAIGSATYNISLILDTQANGAYPNYTDVFETDSPRSFLNLANSQRFKIMKRWYGVINQTAGDGSGAYGSQRKVMKFNKACNIPIEFSSTTGAITEIRSNNLFIMWDTDAGEDDAINVNMSWRLRFSDN